MQLIEIEENHKSDMGRDASESKNQEKRMASGVKTSEALLKSPEVDIHKFQGMSNVTATDHNPGDQLWQPDYLACF